MKKKKWFIMAAIIGFVLSICFALVGCDLLKDCNCSGADCSHADLSSSCSSADFSGCSPNLSGVSCR
ncbi:hypothetical protein [Treponema sp. R80B11-R83G3]